MLTSFVLVTALLVGAPASVNHSSPNRGMGTVTALVRYNACSSAPAGTLVSVIGREVSARTDDGGRFTLSLRPGTYSLVFTGPGLVANQRVDDVVVTLGQTRDLGAIEVWPEERPARCGAGPTAESMQPTVIAFAPDTPALDLPGHGVSPGQASPDQVWVRGGEGSMLGQFGLQGNFARDDEDALGPSSFAVGPHGALWVLDALNGRVQRFDAKGKPVGCFSIVRRGDEPVVESDIAVSDEGHVFVYSESDPPSLTERDSSGRILMGGVLPASFQGVDLLFAGRSRPLLLMLNGQAVRPELGWGGVRAGGPLPGVPAGGLYAHAERLDRWRAVLELTGADGRVRRSVRLHSRVPIAAVRLVGIERRGGAVLAIDRVETIDDGVARAEVLLLSIDPHGHLAGAASVPPGNRRFEFREFAVAPDGTIVQMQSDVSEVRFVRWNLQPPPRGVTAGEGLVRGRVADPGRSGCRVSVRVGRALRIAPVARDGSFELRLPAGTYVLTVRRGNGDGEGSSVDLKVAVAAGATVEVGRIALPPRASQYGMPEQYLR